MRSPYSAPTDTLEGVVIRSQPQGEANLIISIFTPTHGRIDCITRYARTRVNSKQCIPELFDHIQVELVGLGTRNLPSVKTTIPKQAYPELRSSLNALTAAETLVGFQGRTAHALPLDRLQALLRGRRILG